MVSALSKEGIMNTTHSQRGLESRPARGHDDVAYPVALGFDGKEQFLEWIKDKTVINLGSGYGNLVKELARTGVPNKVINVEPAMVIAEQKADGTKTYPVKEASRKATQSITGGDRQAAEELNRAHDRQTIGASWDALPFGDETAEIIISNFGFPFHAKSEEEFDRALEEMVRVLKPGGEIRLFPVKIHEESLNHHPFVNDEMIIATLELKFPEQLEFRLLPTKWPPKEDAGGINSRCLSIKKREQA